MKLIDLSVATVTGYEARITLCKLHNVIIAIKYGV